MIVFLFFLCALYIQLTKISSFLFSRPTSIQWFLLQKCLDGLIRTLSDVNMLALVLSLEKTSKILSGILSPLQVSWFQTLNIIEKKYKSLSCLQKATNGGGKKVLYKKTFHYLVWISERLRLKVCGQYLEMNMAEMWYNGSLLDCLRGSYSQVVRIL